MSGDWQRQLGQAVTAARGRADVRTAVETVYAAVAQAVAQRQPRCEASGRCCRFDAYGHRLYVTTLELAVFVDAWTATAKGIPPAQQGDRPRAGIQLPVRDDRTVEDSCRFQVQGLCSVHAIRPFGCRIFYCDPTAEQWQQEQYERLHAQLKQAHERLGVQYWYVEWRTALRVVLGAGGEGR